MTTETKRNNGILSAIDRRDLASAGIETRERPALPWEVDLRLTASDRDDAIRAPAAVLDWQTSSIRRFAMGYDAGWLLLEVPSEDWDRWARRQERRALLAVHLYADGDAGSTPSRSTTSTTGPDGSELSRRQDAASWEEDDEAALDALERRLCATCDAPENAAFPR